MCLSLLFRGWVLEAVGVGGLKLLFVVLYVMFTMGTRRLGGKSGLPSFRLGSTMCKSISSTRLGNGIILIDLFTA